MTYDAANNKTIYDITFSRYKRCIEINVSVSKIQGLYLIAQKYFSLMMEQEILLPLHNV